MCYRAEALYSIHAPKACNCAIRTSQIEQHPIQWGHPLYNSITDKIMANVKTEAEDLFKYQLNE